MKILIAGSRGSFAEEDFRAICGHVGAFIAQKGHHLLFNSLKQEHADWHVLNGIKGVADTKSRLTYFESVEFNLFKPEKDQDISSLKIEILRVSGDLQMVFLQAIQQADMIILIGGGSFTQVIGQLATLLGKSILPLPWAEGSSYEMWNQFRNKLPQAVVSEIQSITAQKAVEGGPGLIESLSNSVIAIKKQNPFAIEAKQSLKRSVVFLLLTIVVLAGWIFFFTWGPTQLFENPEWKVVIAFATIPLSVFLGAILRLGSPNNVREFVTDISKSLVVAFGLLVTYLYVGFLSSGTIPTISGSSYERFVINFSIIGLAAGLLLEKTQQMLQERLETIVDKATSESQKEG